MKCIFCQTLVLLDHDASSIHVPCWNIVDGYVKAFKAQLQTETNSVDKALFRRLEQVARSKGLWVWTFINRYLEMAVCWEELQEKQTIERLIEDVLFVNEECLEKVWNDTKAG